MTEANCIEVLNEYLSEMTKWELRWRGISQESEGVIFSEARNSMRKDELQKIFDKFLSQKTLNAGQSRLQLLDFGSPPEHDAIVIKVEKKGAKYHIFTRKKNSRRESRYDMIFEDGVWKLDTKAYDSQNWRTQRTVF